MATRSTFGILRNHFVVVALIGFVFLLLLGAASDRIDNEIGKTYNRLTKERSHLTSVIQAVESKARDIRKKIERLKTEQSWALEKIEVIKKTLADAKNHKQRLALKKRRDEIEKKARSLAKKIGRCGDELEKVNSELKNTKQQAETIDGEFKKIAPEYRRYITQSENRKKDDAEQEKAERERRAAIKAEREKAKRERAAAEKEKGELEELRKAALAEAEKVHQADSEHLRIEVEKTARLYNAAQEEAAKAAQELQKLKKRADQLKKRKNDAREDLKTKSKAAAKAETDDRRLEVNETLQAAQDYAIALSRELKSNRELLENAATTLEEVKKRSQLAEKAYNGALADSKRFEAQQQGMMEELSSELATASRNDIEQRIAQLTATEEEKKRLKRAAIEKPEEKQREAEKVAKE
jgi:hypothetical protein